MKTPQEYLKEINHLTDKIKGWHQLPEDYKVNVVTDSYVSITSKMEQGKVPADDYEAYKGYMFITIKRYILRFFEQKKRKVITEYLADTDEPTPSIDNGELTNLKDLQAIIKLLKPLDQQIIQLRLDGYDDKTISLMVGKCTAYTAARNKMIRKKVLAYLELVKKQTKPNPPKKFKHTPHKKVKTYKLTHLVTKYEMIFKTQKELASFLGMTRQGVNDAIKMGRMEFKKMYLLEIIIK